MAMDSRSIHRSSVEDAQQSLRELRQLHSSGERFEGTLDTFFWVIVYQAASLSFGNAGVTTRFQLWLQGEPNCGKSQILVSVLSTLVPFALRESCRLLINHATRKEAGDVLESLSGMSLCLDEIDHLNPPTLGATLKGCARKIWGR
jgi:hypothetical protein